MGKPIIGMAGGIGSGKSAVAGLFGEAGCRVISSDDQISAAYRDPGILNALRERWGEKITTAQGTVDRSAIAARIFQESGERQWLERLLHPWVAKRRELEMEAGEKAPQIVAFVWDTPLLFEAGLNRQCDAVVFVDAPRDVRLERVGKQRGWDAAELDRRENLQWPLDKKRAISDYVIGNSAGVEATRRQVLDVLSRICAKRTREQA